MVTKNDFNENCITYSQMNLIFNSRIFMRRFTTWIRVYIISRYAGIGTADDSFERLYLEATELGGMLRIIFGRNISNSFTQLMRQLTIGSRELITAQLQGDTEAVQQNVDNLYKDTENIAAFLASINPYLNETEWRDMLGIYLRYTIEEANLFIAGNFSRDIEILDRLTNLTNEIGDTFAQALYNYMTSGSQGAEGNIPPRQCVTYDQMNGIYEIRMFWFELASWIRAYMLSRYMGHGDSNELLARLKQVPVNYISMLKQIFSAEDVEHDLHLINNYIDLIDAFITARLEDDTDEVNRITQLLYQNADERAAFLASINPFWDQEEWRARLYGNVRSTIDEFTTFLTEDYARNLDIFSTLLDQAESTSDYYAKGLFDYVNYP